MEARLPVGVSLSLALHVGGGAAWLYLHQLSASSGPGRVISNVELLVRVRPEGVQAQPRAPTPPSTWNFLKLALPTVPRAAPLDVKTAEARRLKPLDVAPKLDDKGRLQKAAGLDAKLDLGRRRADLATVGAARLEPRRAAALAALPKLEEVGTRRAPKAVLAMAALAEERRGRLQALEPAAAQPMKASRALQAAPLLPEESAAPPKRDLGNRLADMLPTEPALPARTLSAPSRLDAVAPAATREEGPAAAPARKKTVEIEGPLKNRKVTRYELPEFPAWAASQGVVEAEVAIRFTVSPAGEVDPEMRVERTSGYGKIDRLALDSLKRWRFQPVPESAGHQWGIITFHFVLD